MNRAELETTAPIKREELLGLLNAMTPAEQQAITARASISAIEAELARQREASQPSQPSQAEAEAEAVAEAPPRRRSRKATKAEKRAARKAARKAARAASRAQTQRAGDAESTNESIDESIDEAIDESTDASNDESIAAIAMATPANTNVATTAAANTNIAPTATSGQATDATGDIAMSDAATGAAADSAAGDTSGTSGAAADSAAGDTSGTSGAAADSAAGDTSSTSGAAADSAAGDNKLFEDIDWDNLLTNAVSSITEPKPSRATPPPIPAPASDRPKRARTVRPFAQRAAMLPICEPKRFPRATQTPPYVRAAAHNTSVAAEEKAARVVAEVRARVGSEHDMAEGSGPCDAIDRISDGVPCPVLSRRIVASLSGEEIAMLPMELRLALPKTPTWENPPRIQMTPVPDGECITIHSTKPKDSCAAMSAGAPEIASVPSMATIVASFAATVLVGLAAFYFIF
ncbi:MAG TPA: hypothetical protein VMZ53_19350 [Kofleriaceae bacterium]|nr:hypothetical protein [Kofleriaceae bacterium]